MGGELPKAGRIARKSAFGMRRTIFLFVEGSMGLYHFNSVADEESWVLILVDLLKVKAIL